MALDSNSYCCCQPRSMSGVEDCMDGIFESCCLQKKAPKSHLKACALLLLAACSVVAQAWPGKLPISFRGSEEADACFGVVGLAAKSPVFLCHMADMGFGLPEFGFLFNEWVI